MSKNKIFFQEFFKSNATEAVEDFRNLKENISNVEISNSKPQMAYQYAQVRNNPRKFN